MYFSALEIPFEYELEGYELPDGVRYLPDFYLPQLKTYVEVKPNADLSRKDFEKIIKFGVNCDQGLLLIVGTPTNEDMYLIDRRTSEEWAHVEDELKDGGITHEQQVAEYFEQFKDWGHVEFGWYPQQESLKHLHLVYRSKCPYLESKLVQAALTAKQARFEHGAKK